MHAYVQEENRCELIPCDILPETLSRLINPKSPLALWFVEPALPLAVCLDARALPPPNHLGPAPASRLEATEGVDYEMLAGHFLGLLVSTLDWHVRTPYAIAILPT